MGPTATMAVGKPSHGWKIFAHSSLHLKDVHFAQTHLRSHEATSSSQTRIQILRRGTSQETLWPSSQAKGEWSFKRKPNAKKVDSILKKFSKKYQVRLLSVANVGNHLHLHIQLVRRSAYKPFIRAITAAITGVSRWTKAKPRVKFWDYRPFSRVVRGFRAALTLKDYVSIN